MTLTSLRWFLWIALFQGGTPQAAVSDPNLAELGERLIAPHRVAMPIVGVVSDESGTPLSDATVELWGHPQRGSPVRHETTTTDARGRFDFRCRGQFDPTRVSIAVRKPGFTPASERLAKRSAGLSSGAWAFPHEIRLLEAAEFRGRVIRHDGEPLTGGRATYGRQRVVIGEDGRFSIPVAPGERCLIEADGCLPRLGPVAWGGKEKTVALEAGVTASGRVVDGAGAGLAGVRVEATHRVGVAGSNAVREVRVEAISDSNGGFELGPLPEEVPLIAIRDLFYEGEPIIDLDVGPEPIVLRGEPTLRLRARLADRSGLPLEVPFVVMREAPYANRRWHGNGTDYLSEPLLPGPGSATIIARGFRPRRIEWRSARGVVDLGEVVLDRGRSIRVSVTDERERAVAGAWIGVHDRITQEYATDVEGRVVVSGLLAGPYQLLVEVPGYHTHVVEVPPSGDELPIRLVRPGRLIVRFVDARRRPLEPLRFGCTFDGALGEPVSLASTRRSPTVAEIERVPPNRPLELQADVSDGRAGPVLRLAGLSSGETREVEYRVANGNVVHGQVRDASGAPVVGALVEVRLHGRSASDTTKSGGEYECEIEGSGTGSVFIMETAAMGGERFEVELGGDSVVEQDLTYLPPHEYSVTVVYGDGTPVAGADVILAERDGPRAEASKFRVRSTALGRATIRFVGLSGVLSLRVRKGYHDPVSVEAELDALPSEVLLRRPARIAVVARDRDTGEVIPDPGLRMLRSSDRYQIRPGRDRWIRPGEYTAIVSKPEYATIERRVELLPGEERVEEFLLERVVPRDADDIPLPEASVHTLSVRFESSPPLRAPGSVTLTPVDLRIRAAQTRSQSVNGDAEFEGVTAGRYYFRYAMGRFVGLFAIDVEGPERVVVTRELRPVQLAGRVTSGGRACRGARVSLWVEGMPQDPARRVFSDATGRYEIETAAGAYTVICESASADLGAFRPVRLTEDSEMDFELEPIRGSIALGEEPSRRASLDPISFPARNRVTSKGSPQLEIDRLTPGEYALRVTHPRLEIFGGEVRRVTIPGFPSTLSDPKLGYVDIESPAAASGECWISRVTALGTSVAVARVRELPCRIALPHGPQTLLFECPGEVTQVARAEVIVGEELSAVRVTPVPAGWLDVEAFGRSPRGVDWNVIDQASAFTLAGTIPAPGFATRIALPPGRYDWTLRTIQGFEARGSVSIEAGRSTVIAPSPLLRTAHFRGRDSDRAPNLLEVLLEISKENFAGCQAELRSGHATYRSRLAQHTVRRPALYDVPPRSWLRFNGRDLGWIDRGRVRLQPLPGRLVEYRIVDPAGNPIPNARQVHPPTGVRSDATALGDAAGTLRVAEGHELRSVIAPGYRTAVAPEGGFPAEITLEPEAH